MFQSAFSKRSNNIFLKWLFRSPGFHSMPLRRVLYSFTMFGQISLLFVAIFTSVAAQGCTPTFLDFSSMPDGMSPLNMGFIDVWCGKNTAISGGHLVLNVTQECGPDIASTTMVNAGKFEVNMTTGYSSGIVTAFTLLSEGTEQRDEMDMEFLGKNMSYGK